MQKKGVDANKISQFTDCMVSINTNAYNSVEGQMERILCKSSDSKRELITVQTKIGCHSKLYWILSNFGKHLNTHLKKVGRKRSIDDGGNNFSSSDNNDGKILASSMHKHESSNSCVNEIEDEIQNDEMDNKPQSSNNLTTRLSIVSTDVGDLESIIYNQISDQLIEMKNAAMTHNESQIEMKFLIENVPHELQAVEIDANGSCLFGASVHQILKTEISSKLQSNETKKLRGDVVVHIQENLLQFKRELEGTVQHVWGPKVKSNLELACKYFLEKELPKNDTWGGSESLKAISQLNKVNILVLTENGDFYFACRFDAQFKQTIILAYTTFHFEEHEVTDCKDGVANVLNVSNIERIHYNSVINIDQNDVFILSKELALQTYKQITLAKEKFVSINDTL